MLVVTLAAAVGACGTGEVDRPAAPGPPGTTAGPVEPVGPALPAPGAGCDRPGPPAPVLRTTAGGALAPTSSTLVQATGGDGVFFGVTPDGRALTWSDDDPEPRPVPAPAGTGQPLGDVVQVAADGSTAAFLTRDGLVHVWSDNTSGQAGDGTRDPLTTPSTVTTEATVPLEEVVDVAVDGRTLAAVRSDGTVFVWGDTRHGQLGAGSAGQGPATTATPVTRPDGTVVDTVVDVAVGGQHVIAATREGRVLTWGSDSHGQLGTPGTAEVGAPTEADVPGVVTSVAASELDSFAVTDDGQVFAWGNDESGQTGTGGEGGLVGEPTPVAGAADVSCLVAGEAFAAALTTGGEVLSWGAGGRGQLAAGEVRQRREAGPALTDGGAEVTDASWVGASQRVLLVGVDPAG